MATPVQMPIIRYFLSLTEIGFSNPSSSKLETEVVSCSLSLVLLLLLSASPVSEDFSLFSLFSESEFLLVTVILAEVHLPISVDFTSYHHKLKNLCNLFLNLQL